MNDNNKEAERAADLAEFAKWKGYELPVLNNHGQFHQDWLHREFVAFCAGRRRHTAVGDDGLPPLPEPKAEWVNEEQGFQYLALGWFQDGTPLYTAEQYRQGQREAVAADRLARVSIDGQLTGAPSPVKQDAQQPASAAQGVKTWQERMAEYYSADGSKLAHGTSHFKDQEIADLRAQLAATTENLQTAVREAWETHAELSTLRAQLALKSQEGACG